MTRLDEICLDMKRKGKKYADWQKERYPVRAGRTWREREKESAYGKERNNRI